MKMSPNLKFARFICQVFICGVGLHQANIIVKISQCGVNLGTYKQIIELFIVKCQANYDLSLGLFWLEHRNKHMRLRTLAAPVGSDIISTFTNILVTTLSTIYGPHSNNFTIFEQKKNLNVILFGSAVL